ncbi:MAG TPA: response regulator [Candidatus Acidoferrales bacterium]|nr:response regulator [Candidatus Acidoferrales bacterium]
MHKILLIDDDDSMRKLLRTRLEHSYEIIETPDPEEGIVLALERKPDAILLDLMMPKYSGFEICQTLSALSFTQQIPIFIVSGESAERYRDFCNNLGAKGFFQKPVDFAALRKQLEAAIDGHSAKRPEVRVRFRTPVKLIGQDATGIPLHVTTVTDSVTANGFSCECPAGIEEGSIVEVRLAKDGHPLVGQAKAVRIESPVARGQTCAFQFIEAPRDWILP